LIFTGLYCPDPETEINDMAQPYRRKDNTGHPYALPCHHKEAEAHKQCNCDYDTQLGFKEHTFMLDAALPNGRHILPEK
jgi:hypothetical protein